MKKPKYSMKVERRSDRLYFLASVLLMFKIVNFFTKLSDQRERTIVDRAVARIWLAAQPPRDTHGQ